MLMAENGGSGVYTAGRNFGDLAPCAKGNTASRTMLVGTEAMTAELEVVMDPVGGEKALRLTR